MALMLMRSNIIKENDISFLSPKKPDIERLRYLCNEMVKENYDEINLLELNNLEFYFTNIKKSHTIKIFRESFDIVTKKIYNKINEQIKNNSFMILTLRDNIKKFNDISQIFINSLPYYKNIRHNKKEKYLSGIKKLSFSENIVNAKYTESSLSDIVGSKIVEEKNIETVIDLFNFYVRFLRFGEDKFMMTLGSNSEFMLKLVKYVDNLIVDTDEKNKILLKNSFKMVRNLNETELFNKHYKRFLENRLLQDRVDITKEKNILKMFRLPEDNKIVSDMLNMINDISMSKKYIEDIKNIEIVFESEKYKNFDKNSFDVNKINTKILRHYAWNYCNIKSEIYSLPLELEIYVDILKFHYNEVNNNRQLRLNMNIGNAIIELDINKRKYQIEVTTPQLIILTHLNKEKRSAKELQKILNTSLPNIENILNSLIKSRIVRREEGYENNDPNMIISLNKKFYYPETKISLTHLMELNEKMVDKIIEKEFALGRENILMARIVRVLKKSKELSHKELVKKVNKKLPFEPTEKLFNETIGKCITKDYIKLKDKDNIVYYKYYDMYSKKDKTKNVSNSMLEMLNDYADGPIIPSSREDIVRDIFPVENEGSNLRPHARIPSGEEDMLPIEPMELNRGNNNEIELTLYEPDVVMNPSEQNGRIEEEDIEEADIEGNVEGRYSRGRRRR